MKRIFVASIVIVASVAVGLPADEVEVTFNRDYARRLIEEVYNADSVVHVIMFSAGYYPQYPRGLNDSLYDALAYINRQGVEVKLILDQSDWNPSVTRKNVQVAKHLHELGITEVYFDPPDVTTHCKVVIIDGKIVFVGSHNWTYYALQRNNEATVMIVSREVATMFEQYFDQLLRVSTKTLPAVR